MREGKAARAELVVKVDWGFHGVTGGKGGSPTEVSPPPRPR